MARWKDDRLDLGALGVLSLSDLGDGWAWQLVAKNGNDVEVGRHYPTAARARKAAEAWMRRALKQAGKGLEGKP